MMPPVPQGPQKWQCALCLASYLAWQEQNRPALEQAMADVKARIEAGNFDPQDGSQLPEAIRQPPPVYDAVTMTTVPNLGPALVCTGHVTPAASGSSLLIATATVPAGGWR